MFIETTAKLAVLAGASVAPWDSPDSTTDNAFYLGRDSLGRFAVMPGLTDGPKSIDYCLHHCPYASSDCVNCLGNQKRRRKRAALYEV